MCQYYRYADIGTDTDTDINVGAPLLHTAKQYKRADQQGHKKF